MPAPAFDPTQPFEPIGAPAFDPAKPFDVVGSGHLSDAVGATGVVPPALPAALADIPKETVASTSGAWNALKNLTPQVLGGNRDTGNEGVMEGQLNTGKMLLAAVGLPFSPITGVAHSLLGHPLADATVAAGKVLSPSTKVDPNEIYERSKEGVDTALSALAPGRGGLASLRAPPAPALPGMSPFGVDLSAGQESGQLPLIQTEQAGLRGQLGPTAQARAQAFRDQQAAQLDSAGQNISQGLDPFGQTLAENPQEAGSLVSQSIRDTAAQRKAGVSAAYDYARDLPGEIHAGVFEGIGQRIKGDLSLRDDPIVIDDRLAPFASQAIKDVDNRVSNLIVQNRADPFAPSSAENIVGVNLKGVDQMRRRLSSFRNDAFASGNAADGRAAKAVLDAFDDQVDQAVNGGAFTGDPRAIQAWNDARAAHADFRRTFGAGKNDPVGPVVEKILGKGANPAAIPNDVADFMYGGTGVNPSSLNVGVANRVKGILGEQSPEWSAVKQGLFARLTDPGEGMTPFGPGKIAQRLNKFLNADGTEMSEAVFSPAERQMLQAYADLHRKLEIPQAGANWSNTSTFMQKTMNKISGAIGAGVGSVLGHLTGLPFGAGEGAGFLAAKGAGALANRAQVQKIAQQMPLVADQVAKWQRAVIASNRANTPLANTTARIASVNLARSLEKLGLNPFGSTPIHVMQNLQGTLPAGAQQNQTQ